MAQRSGSGDVVRRRAGLRKRSVDAEPGGSSSTREIDFGEPPPWSEWHLMPSEVLVDLEKVGIDSIAACAVGAMEPKVRRRGDQYLERANAWYVDRESFVLVDAVRALERRADGKFRPTESWRLTARRRAFVGQVRERSGTVPVDADVHNGGSVEARSQAWVQVIDVLPARVRKQVLTTVPEPSVDLDTLMQGNHRGVPADHEASLVRATTRQMIAVRATRTISVTRSMSRDAAEARLAETPWSVMTLAAQLGPEQTTEFVAGANRHLQVPWSVRDGLSSGQNALPRD